MAREPCYLEGMVVNLPAFIEASGGLAAFEDAPGDPGDVADRACPGLRVYVTAASDEATAGLAFEDGVVGYFLGRNEDGSPARVAFDVNFDVVA